MFYDVWYNAPSCKWILEMRLVSGHFGDGVWSRIKGQEREEEQLAMGFVDKYSPLLFGLVNDGEWTRCVAAGRHHSLTVDRTWKPAWTEMDSDAGWWRSERRLCR